MIENDVLEVGDLVRSELGSYIGIIMRKIDFKNFQYHVWIFGSSIFFYFLKGFLKKI